MAWLELQSKQNVEFAIQYVKWLDRYVPDVYREALKNFDTNKIQEAIDRVYEKVFGSETVQALKQKMGVEPEAYTESLKRIKIRIR